MCDVDTVYIKVDSVNIFLYIATMSSKKKKKTYHHGDLRNSLLVAAEKELRQKGTDISLREVAKVAGVSHTAPYRHFKDKTALLQALAASGYQRLAEGVRAAKDQHADEPIEAMLGAARAYVELAVNNPEMTQLMFGGVLDQEVIIEEDLGVCSGDAFQALLEVVDLGLEHDVYQSDNRMEIALANWSMVHGLSMLITCGQLSGEAETDESVQGLTRMVGEMLMTGLKKKT